MGPPSRHQEKHDTAAILFLFCVEKVKILQVRGQLSRSFNTRQMEIEFSSLRRRCFISRTINIAVIPIITLLLLDGETCPVFYILQDCKSFLSGANERTVGTGVRPASTLTLEESITSCESCINCLYELPHHFSVSDVSLARNPSGGKLEVNFTDFITSKYI